MNKEKSAWLKSLENIEYYQCDITDRDEVFGLIESIKSKYKQLNGIIHSAGITRDGFILKKFSEEALQVLSPKIIGAKNLDEATKGEALDFFCIFLIDGWRVRKHGAI